MESGSEYVIKLNGYAQKHLLKAPQYKDLGSSGPSHMKTFKQSVHFNGRDYPEGVGRSKKEAKHNAAKNAYEILSKGNTLTQGPDQSSSEPFDSPDKESTNFMVKISEYCQQNKYSHNFIEVNREGPSHNLLFYYKLEIDKKDYPVAKGKTIKEAKQKAAQEAWSVLQEPLGLDSKGSEGSDEAEDKIQEPTQTTWASQRFEEQDFISKISGYCQQNNFSQSYIEVNRKGPSHNPLFYYKLVIDKKDYPEAQGKTVKEAKQKAAQQAWSVIKEQSSLDNKLSDCSAGSDESGLLARGGQSSSGSSWIQFEASSKSDSIISPTDSDAVMKQSSRNELPITSTYSKINSEYDSIEPLGNGAFGCVYKARNKDLERYFAIKEIEPKDPKKSLQEVKVLADLHHPNIVRYYTFWFENTGYKRSTVKSNSKFLFIEMELCNGGTLRRWIHEKNKESSGLFRRNQSLKIAQQILSGVEYIHSKKLIHRDLKPENIFFGQDGNVRIGDFGLVTQDNDEGEIVERTEDKGTPNYMAPEQVGVNYDRKVDVFALGLIFFELLWRIATGHERGMIWPGVRRQNLPKEFIGTYTIESHIIKTMLSEKPDARPEASAIKAEIEQWNPDGHDDQGNQTI